MRYRRGISLLALAPLVVAGVVLASSSPGSAPTAAARAHRVQRPAAAGLAPLVRSAPWTARPQIVVPHLHQFVPLPGPATCFVGPGRCSESPCVVPVQSASLTTAASAALDTSITRRVWPNQAASQGCPGRRGTPHILRVIGR